MHCHVLYNVYTEGWVCIFCIFFNNTKNPLAINLTPIPPDVTCDLSKAYIHTQCPRIRFATRNGI